MGPESKVEAALVAAVSRAGGVAYKWLSPGRRGVPDRIVVMPGGRVSFVECKAPGRRVSPLQDIELARLRRLGCEVLVVASVNEIREVW